MHGDLYLWQGVQLSAQHLLDLAPENDLTIPNNKKSDQDSCARFVISLLGKISIDTMRLQKPNYKTLTRA